MQCTLFYCSLLFSYHIIAHCYPLPCYDTRSFSEVWKGRDSFSDAKARTETIEVLKKMIGSWLDEYYPEMPQKERQRMAEGMDLSLIENKKEESMKTFYEINNVIRMSFIEMQYMKKVSKRIIVNTCSSAPASIVPASFIYSGNDECFTSYG